MGNLIPLERIESRIYLIRGQKVMLDNDLAELYGVETFNLNKAVKRNKKRFPDDFMFRLTQNEWQNLKFHSGISNLKSHFVMSRWGGRRTLPYAFTEQGVAMLSSVLNSERAIQMNIQIMRAFIRLNQFIHAHKELERKFELLEEKVGKRLKRQDEEITAIFNLIKKMLTIEEKPKRRIGFAI